MKILCQVQIHHNGSATECIGSAPQKPFVQSTLAISVSPKHESQTFILHFTNANKSGTRYNVKDNIDKVFTRFIEEGKCTIRFKIPAIDMCIKTDSVQLKGFLKVFKMCCMGVVPKSALPLSNITATAISPNMRPVTKMVIQSRAEYPIKGLPRTVQFLEISGLGIQQFRTNILQLRNLRSLNLSNNKIENLPPELGEMPYLSELNLSKNNLHASRLCHWDWIYGSRIQTSLKTLDLSWNKLVVLPDSFPQLSALVVLSLRNNELQCLPPRMGYLKSLRALHLDNNNLKYFPGSMLLLRLETLEISLNPCYEDIRGIRVASIYKVQSLKAQSGQVVLHKGLQYSSATIPKTVVSYLNQGMMCLCRKPILEQYCTIMDEVDLKLCTRSLASTKGSNISAKVDYCSKKCLSLLNRLYRI